MTVLRSFLGMYDLPAQAAANDRIWAAIAGFLRARGLAGIPSDLTRDVAPDALWRDPALLFGQACGYPLVRHSLPLRVLALPIYAAPGAEGASHRSYIVARRHDGAGSLADFRGRRAAVNDRSSNTGMNLFRAAIAPLAEGKPFFADVVVTGSHRDSARAVVSGDADVAAIDSVTFAGLARFEPDLIRPLRIVAETPSSPTLPFVTARATPVEAVAALRLALEMVVADPALASARDALHLAGVAAPSADALAPIAAIERRAAAIGYAELA